MAYIGKTPSQATRSRFYYTATGGETSLSGADDNSNTLVFSDGNYVDVMLNGVNLVAGTDYNTTTTNTIGGLTALTASDIVEIVVYDTFSVFGGDVKGNFNVQNGTLTAETVTASGLVTAQDGLVVDNDGATVATFDRATSDGTIVDLQKDGSTTGRIGTNGGEGYFSSSATGIKGSGSSAILPTNNTGASADGNRDLGSTSVRWRNAYFSGGVFLGGTGSANKIEDYEEGTFSGTLTPNSGSFTMDTARDTLQYTKIGRVVNISGYTRVASASSASGVITLTLPFTTSNGGEFEAVTAGTAIPENLTTGTSDGFGIFAGENATNALIQYQAGGKQSFQWTAVAEKFGTNTNVRINFTYITDA